MTWIDRYYSKTRSPFAELARHFFVGLFHPESTAGEDSFTTWLVQILAALIAASWFLPVQLFRRYADLHALAGPQSYLLAYSSDCLSALVFMMLLVGLVTVLEWKALFPTRRDHLVLTPLPLTRTQLFGAKLAALILFITLFIAAITLLSGIALPAIATGPWELRPLWVRAAALLAAAVGSCYFVFLALLATQGLLMMALPVRWFEPVSFGVQVMLLIALLCAFPLFPHFPSQRLVAAQSPWLDWAPPAWYWGLAEWIAGAGEPMAARLAARAGVAFALALGLAATAYLFSYLEYSRYALEVRREDRPPAISWSTLFGRWFGPPQARAVAEFVMSTLWRGREQKLAFLLILAVGLALVFENSVYLASRLAHLGSGAAAVESAVIGLPLTLSFFAMLGLRRAFRTPGDLPANRLFRFAEDPAVRRSQLDSVFRVFVRLGGFAILLICAPLEFVMIGARALWAVLAQLLLALTLAEYLLQGWRAIPFTFAQNPARRHFLHSAIFHLVELSIYSFTSSTWISAGIHKPIVLVEFEVVVLAAFVLLRRNRRRNWGQEPFEFEEAAPAAVESIRLAGD